MAIARSTTVSRLRRLALCAAVALFASLGARADKLHLKDGRVLEGTVQREGPDFVYFVTKVGGIDKVEFFLRKDVSKIERDSAPAGAAEGVKPDARPAAVATPAPAKPAEDATPAPVAQPHDGATRIAFIELGDPPLDMVGTYMNSGALKESVKRLEDDKPDIVVLKINSGGGYALEVPKLNEYIHKEMKPKFRVVAWIQSAISAAAMTAHVIEEIYFLPKGNYGACTMFSMSGPGQAKAAEGRSLEEVLFGMEKVSVMGRYDPLIMRAMQVEQPLSCDIDENGVVHWRGDLEGQHIVNPKGRILTFNSQDAVKFKFAKGVAETKQELAKLLIGDTEWVEVGQDANKYQEEYRQVTHEAELAMNQLNMKLNLAMGQATQQQDPAERGKHIGSAKRIVSELKAYARKSPGIGTYVLPEEFFKMMDEIFRKLAEGQSVPWPPQGGGEG